jgi:bifunctional non-homologous end joining protein LigD
MTISVNYLKRDKKATFIKLASMHIDSVSLEIDKQDKIYFPESKISKEELIGHYNSVSDVLLPHVENRPLALWPNPDGINGNNSFQNKITAHFTKWNEPADILRNDGKIIRQIVCNGHTALINLVKSGCVELHAWSSTASHIQRPDKLVFDLDPPEDNFDWIRKGAKILRQCLEDELKLVTFPMTTGTRGLHVVVPIRPTLTFREVEQFAKMVTDYLVLRESGFLTNNAHKARKEGKLLVDYRYNSYGQASVVPYSVRGLPGAPVAAPLNWDELSQASVTSRTFNVQNIYNRLVHADTVWSGFEQSAKKLDYRLEQLNEILA